MSYILMRAVPFRNSVSTVVHCFAMSNSFLRARGRCDSLRCGATSIYLFYKPFILYCKIEKFKKLFVELNIRLQKNKWRGQDIVKLITCPLIKLQFYLG